MLAWMLFWLASQNIGRESWQTPIVSEAISIQHKHWKRRKKKKQTIEIIMETDPKHAGVFMYRDIFYWKRYSLKIIHRTLKTWLSFCNQFISIFRFIFEQNVRCYEFRYKNNNKNSSRFWNKYYAIANSTNENWMQCRPFTELIYWN